VRLREAEAEPLDSKVPNVTFTSHFKQQQASHLSRVLHFKYTTLSPTKLSIPTDP
jgi:hypothetical protein